MCSSHLEHFGERERERKLMFVDESFSFLKVFFRAGSIGDHFFV